LKDEIKEILVYYQKDIDKYEKNIKNYTEYQQKTTFSKNYQRYKNHKLLLDYITNLQEENHRLKELCDKYEEEHITTFNEWKETITDKYQTLKDLQQENERLKKRNKEIYDGFIATQEELSDYATRIDKAIRYIHKNYYEVVYKTKGTMENDLLNILNGGDEE
jgi:cell shape-determining protein MreC